MKIGLLRHAKVIHRESFFSKGKIFDESRIRYDISPVELIKLKIKAQDFPLCYVSSQHRAVETAKMVYNGKFIITDDLIEVPSAAVLLFNVNLPTFIRSIIGRIAWFFNYQKMPETRKETTERAGRFINLILQLKSQNILLITHGFFMHSLKKELRKHGFKGYLPFFPRNGFLYLFKNKN
jgi:broad specificity phosphatase PhoE